MPITMEQLRDATEDIYAEASGRLDALYTNGYADAGIGLSADKGLAYSEYTVIPGKFVPVWPIPQIFATDSHSLDDASFGFWNNTYIRLTYRAVNARSDEKAEDFDAFAIDPFDPVAMGADDKVVWLEKLSLDHYLHILLANTGPLRTADAEKMKLKASVILFMFEANMLVPDKELVKTDLSLEQLLGAAPRSYASTQGPLRPAFSNVTLADGENAITDQDADAGGGDFTIGGNFWTPDKIADVLRFHFNNRATAATLVAARAINHLKMNHATGGVPSDMAPLLKKVVVPAYGLDFPRDRVEATEYVTQVYNTIHRIPAAKAAVMLFENLQWIPTIFLRALPKPLRIRGDASITMRLTLYPAGSAKIGLAVAIIEKLAAEGMLSSFQMDGAVGKVLRMAEFVCQNPLEVHPGKGDMLRWAGGMKLVVRGSHIVAQDSDAVRQVLGAGYAFFDATNSNMSMMRSPALRSIEQNGAPKLAFSQQISKAFAKADTEDDMAAFNTIVTSVASTADPELRKLANRWKKAPADAKEDAYEALLEDMLQRNKRETDAIEEISHMFAAYRPEFAEASDDEKGDDADGDDDEF